MNRGVKFKSLLVGSFLLACGLLVLGQQGSVTESPKEPCASDPLMTVMQRAFPAGVPGRNLPAPSKIEKVDADFIFYIPVVVHIMHLYGAEMNVSEEQVLSQIDVLNQGYGRYGTGFNDNPAGGRTNMRFCLAQVDPDGKPTPGYEHIASPYAPSLNPLTDDTLMKRTTIWDPKRYLNIWTVAFINGGYEGYAYLPSEVAGSVWDGIIVRHTSFGSYPYGTSTTFGNTIVHEVGHFLGLYHPWGLVETDCANAGTDFCEDTPPVPAIYFSHWPSCESPVACDGLLRQITNYMDYSDDACQNLFTNDQVARMLDNLLTYRAEMVTGSNIASVGCQSIADTMPATDSIYIYPIPATTFLNVNLDYVDVGSAFVELTDMTGRVVFKEAQAASGRGPFVIDVRQLSQGIYSLRVKTNKADIRRMLRIGY